MGRAGEKVGGPVRPKFVACVQQRGAVRPRRCKRYIVEPRNAIPRRKAPPLSGHLPSNEGWPVLLAVVRQQFVSVLTAVRREEICNLLRMEPAPPHVPDTISYRSGKPDAHGQSGVVYAVTKNARFVRSTERVEDR